MTPRTVSEAEAPDEVAEQAAAATGPLWPDAYAVTWPRSGGAGTCSHTAPDSCPRCDGTDAAQQAIRDAWKAQRR